MAMTFKSLLKAYWIDYVVLLILLVLNYGYMELFVPPFKQLININDPSIAYPKADPETVPVWALGVISVIIPLVVITLTWYIWPWIVPGGRNGNGNSKRSSHLLHHALLGLAYSLIATAFLTNATKLYIGRLRPDFLSRCDVDQPLVADILNSFANGTEVSNTLAVKFGSLPDTVLFTEAICKNAGKSALEEGRKSFFSGHTSLSFAGLVYLSIFLFFQFRHTKPHYYKYLSTSTSSSPVPSTNRPTTYFPDLPNILTLAFFIPFFGACCIGYSRIADYRHFWADVFIGGVVGTLLAVWAYAWYFWIVPLKGERWVAVPKEERWVAVGGDVVGILVNEDDENDNVNGEVVEKEDGDV